MEFLVTNDDGIRSAGIQVAVDLLLNFGNVYVVAPSEVQSGKSASLSLGQILRVKETFESVKGSHKAHWVALDGTPADCVKMGMQLFFQDHRPDFCFSGINQGSNASIAAVYSGTLGAAAEATIYAIPTIAFSIDTHNEHPDFSQVEKFYDTILHAFFKNPPRKGFYLNVNFPNIPAGQVKGIKFARMGRGRWIKEFDVQKDPFGKTIYWMVGKFQDFEELEARGDALEEDRFYSSTGDSELLDADKRLVDQGYIAISVHKVDNSNVEEALRLSQAWKL